MTVTDTRNLAAEAMTTDGAARECLKDWEEWLGTERTARFPDDDTEADNGEDEA